MNPEDEKRIDRLIGHGQFKEAYSFLTQIFDVYKNDWTIYDKMAWLEINLNKECDKAITYIEKAKEKGAPLDRYHRIRADVYWTQGKKNQAVIEFEEAVKHEPSIDNLTALANAWMHLDYEKAYQIWETVIRKQPESKKANLALSWIFGKRGDFNEALQQAQKVIGFYPEEPEAFLYAARAQQGLQRYKDAIQYYLSAQQKGCVQDFFFYKNLAICYFEVNDYIKAFISARNCYMSFPNEFTNDEISKKCREYILWLCGNKMDEESYECLRISLEIWPDDSVFYAYMASFECYYKKNYSLGQSYINKAFEISHSQSDVLYMIKGSLLYDCFDNKIEGIKYLEKSVLINRNPVNLVALAARISETDKKKSKELYKEVLLKEAENKDALYGLALLPYDDSDS